MLPYHRVLSYTGDEIPVTPCVLGIIQQILPNHSDVWVGEESSKTIDEFAFLILRPVTFRSFKAHEWNADCICSRPSDSSACDMAASSFEIEREFEGLS